MKTAKKKLSPERIKELERELEKADREIDSIIQTYYAAPGGQNVGGEIGMISRLHAQLVEQLAEAKRGLTKNGKV